MNRVCDTVAIVVLVAVLAATPLQAQGPLQMVTETAHRHGAASSRHAGIHSGSWTLKREQILEAESHDEHRSCRDPNCLRCSKHLADYGHEHQYVGGPKQRQLWYRGTAGSIAPVTQRGYDQHGLPYARRGQPGAVMSWEYQRTLNHAIWEQVQARNAVAAEEAAEDRLTLLTELHAVAVGLLETSEAHWNTFKDSCCTGANACQTRCDYCSAKAQYAKDRVYVAEVARELASAQRKLAKLTAIANEKVRIALLSKDDADRATHFQRVQHKPPKYQEVLNEDILHQEVLAAQEGQEP